MSYISMEAGRDGERARCLSIAAGSASEAEYQLLLARDLGYLQREAHRQLDHRVSEVRRMLYSFIQKLSVISPLLSNIYLHEVVDTWWALDVLPRLRGRAFMVRYADETLGQKLSGHFRYYGIRGNSHAINRFHYEARRLRRKWLKRRFQRGYLTWEKFNRLLQRYRLPPARLRPGGYQLRLANL